MGRGTLFADILSDLILGQETDEIRPQQKGDQQGRQGGIYRSESNIPEDIEEGDLVM
jgi:hypothetical protein